MKRKIVFLFLNGLHHLFHTVTTAMELGTIDKESDVICLSCNDEHSAILTEVLGRYPDTITRIIQLKEPFRYKYLNYKKKAYPSVNAMISRATKLLKETDLVVTTSHGTPGILNKYRIDRPFLIYQDHGCGDRRYSFDPEFNYMDFMLLPGRYHQKRLIDEKIVKEENTEIVGWPKLDYIGNKRLKLFNNSKPTVLYCPHWKPSMSSYKKFAVSILEYFGANRNYNLIFAPHLLLKHWHVHHKFDISLESYACENIIVDYGSNSSSNGTYLKAADIYIGDVSSLVYEFIAIQPRPCLFLNAHDIKWKNNPDYRFWDYGPVVKDISSLGANLDLAINNTDFLDMQKKRITEYLDISQKPGSIRAAEAIHNYSVNIDYASIPRRKLKQ